MDQGKLGYAFTMGKKAAGKLFREPLSALEAVKVIKLASKVYNAPIRRVFWHSIKLLLRRGYKPMEALSLGLMDPNLPESELDLVISKSNMSALEQRLNPISWRYLTEDKGIFYTFCKTMGIPVPEMYALFFKSTPGWTSKGLPLPDREAWVDYIRNDLPSEFAIKPSGGGYGFSFQIYKRRGDGFEDGWGNPFTAEQIYNALAENPRFASFLIQERLTSHAGLVELTGTEACQTARVITLVDNAGEVRELHSYMKIIVGKNIADNHDWGRTGNLLAAIDMETGKLSPGAALTLDGEGIKTFETHPDTGVRFADFTVPLFEEVLALARESALRFLPIRSIGWDVAMTPQGVKIVEANFYYDPANAPPAMAKVLPHLYEILNDK